MPKKNKTLCVDDLRHAEYYDMQPVFDELYHRSLEGENFTDLMDLILSRDNILLAYRNIKANGGSYTAGTDNKNISDIGCLPPETVAEKVRFIVTGSQHGYRPKPVRRKDIPKPNGKTRPLGIPCIWDRLVQQCIKQVIEPICEAKFSDNSYGFRPNRSVEHAVQKTYTMLQLLWSSFFVTLVAKKIVLINLCCRPCFIWGSITIITVWTNMIIINVCKFFYLLIECFLCCKLIQICAFILQGIEVTLHRCIVVRISCFAHALCHIYRVAEFGKCFGRIL